MSLPIHAAVEYDFAGSRARVLLSGKDSGGAVSVMEMFAPPGKSTPLHAHALEEETVIVLDGVVDVTINGVTVSAQAGHNVRLPRDSAHRIANNGSEPARYLLVCAPAGFEAFIDDVAEAHSTPVTPTPPGPEQIARMRAAAGRFGISLLPG